MEKNSFFSVSGNAAKQNISNAHMPFLSTHCSSGWWMLVESGQYVKFLGVLGAL